MGRNNFIKLRHGTAVAWSGTNPILGSGEPGYDITNNLLKIGDGTGNWNSLSGINSDTFTEQLNTELQGGTGIDLFYDTSTDTGILFINIDSTVMQTGDNISLLNNDAVYLTGHPIITDAADGTGNVGNTFIQDVLLDSFGHVTGFSSSSTSDVFVTGINGTGNYIPKFSDSNSITNSIIHQSGHTLGINDTASGGNITLHAHNINNTGSWIVNENAQGNSIYNVVFEARESGTRLGAMYSYGTAYAGGSVASVGSGGTAFTSITGPVAVGPNLSTKDLIFGAGQHQYAKFTSDKFIVNNSGLNRDFIVYGTGTHPLIYTDPDSGPGRVGIGRVPDSYILDVSGSTRVSPISTATRILTVNNTSGGTTAFEIDPDSVYTRLPLGVNITGSVNTAYGIEVYDTGISSTGTFFFAAGNGNDAVGAYVSNINATGDSFYALGVNGSAVNWVMMNDASGRGTEDTFVLMKGNISSNDVKLAVTASGDIGMGTDSPQSKLDVSGTITASGFATSTGTSSQFLTADGGFTSTVPHQTISAASSSDNSGKTFIQDILLDTNGHVTGITAESSIPTRYNIRADGSTNTFTTEDSYILSRIDIFQNGVKLYDGEDFVATNGTSFTLNNTIPSGSLIEYIIDLSQTFNPASVSGLKMWVDADDGNTITNTAFGISQWNDKSSNGHNLTQSNTSHRPQLSTGALGARNVVNFNGTDERMVCDPIATGVFNGDQIPYSTVVVWRSTGSSTKDTIYAAANNSTTARVHYRVTTDSTPQYDAFRLDDSGDLKRLTDSYTHNTFIVASITFGGSVFRHYTNGTDDDFTIGSEDNTSVFNFTVGAAKVAGAFVEFLEGDIAELLIYDHELSDSDRINIENYLMSKWGIS